MIKLGKCVIKKKKQNTQNSALSCVYQISYNDMIQLFKYNIHNWAGEQQWVTLWKTKTNIVKKKNENKRGTKVNRERCTFQYVSTTSHYRDKQWVPLTDLITHVHLYDLRE